MAHTPIWGNRTAYWRARLCVKEYHLVRSLTTPCSSSSLPSVQEIGRPASRAGRAGRFSQFCATRKMSTGAESPRQGMGQIMREQKMNTYLTPEKLLLMTPNARAQLRGHSSDTMPPTPKNNLNAWDNPCSGCLSCEGCKACDDCKDCSYCSSCTRCTGCSECVGCEDCSGCRSCIKCLACVCCVGITNANGLKYVYHGVQLTEPQWDQMTKEDEG